MQTSFSLFLIKSNSTQNLNKTFRSICYAQLHIDLLGKCNGDEKYFLSITLGKCNVIKDLWFQSLSKLFLFNSQLSHQLGIHFTIGFNEMMKILKMITYHLCKFEQSVGPEMERI